MPSHHFFQADQLAALEQKFSQLDLQCQYDEEKHRWDIFRTVNGAGAQLRWPIHYQPGEGLVDRRYLMVLIQSGSAAVGVFENDVCLSHKVFSAYMVRKKQGKSQIKHLKTKGKSRAGSRVRLAKTLEFFENVNTRLQDHCAAYDFDRITISCSKILLPYWFGSKVPVPFEKKDPRLYRIPKHLHQPNYEVLLGMHRFLLKAELTYEESDFPELNTLLSC